MKNSKRVKAKRPAEVSVDTAQGSPAPAEKPERLPRKKLRRGAISRWWRMAHVRSNEPPAVDEQSVREMEKVCRRAEDALSSARERIESDISAATPPESEQIAAAQTEGRSLRGPDKWQRDDNAFNEVSRAVHARASGAVRDIRSSMSTRISINYARVLWETMVIVIVVIAALMVFMVLPRLNSLSEEVAGQVETAAHAVSGGLSTLPEPTPAPSPPALYAVTSPPQEGGAGIPDERESIRLIDISLNTQDKAYAQVSGMDGRVYYDDAPFDLSRGTLLRFWQGEFYYVRSSFVNVRGNTYQLYVCTALTYWLWLALWVIGGLVGLDAMRGAYFILRGHSLNAEFIRPIEKISETARHLNAQNMSERIDVEGTHSELRELALVINDMLDRMETAYDGQKQFVSDASHELRTPIAVIQGYANMLERWGKDDKEVRDEAIAAINKEAANMKELVEKLLFLARHDKQTLKMKSELVDLRALAEDAVRETRMIVKDREIIAGEMQDVSVLGDSASLKQALRIFIDNACKYTPPGGKVTVSCTRGGLGALLSVADTGRGIPAADLKKIFDRFYRVDDSRGAVPGHGLGLSIARIIAVSHGGRINVRSKEGAGSVFTLELPGIKK